MTKAEFVKRLAQEASLPPGEAARALEAFITVVRESLKNGEDVQFAGFGKFSVVERGARQGVNPRSPGTRIEIPARKVPKFTPGAVLRQAVGAPPPPPPPAAKKRRTKKADG
jgi:DNA-binding protein HU-beta